MNLVCIITFISQGALRRRYSYCPHCTDEEADAHVTCPVSELVIGGDSVLTQIRFQGEHSLLLY